MRIYTSICMGATDTYCKNSSIHTIRLFLLILKAGVIVCMTVFPDTSSCTNSLLHSKFHLLIFEDCWISKYILNNYHV